ncbi:MAG: ribosome small subunit-dependent GTPase A [Propionibacteriaceae bacterium]|jgi:ribosome biogenesis GTPase|nr:ribosome small subunit-dependent GTPase A [Propionibacteriaceae bacterium]
MASSITTDPEEGFGRPPKRTRPRTKDRPDYSAAPEGAVMTIDRGRYTCLLDGRPVVAVKARNLGQKVIVGDRVKLVGDVSGQEGTLARIVEVEARQTVLRRTADDDDPHERPIVANADQLAIVTALADPPPRPGMIDRVLVAAYDAGIAPILILTKADLADAGWLLDIYAPLGLPVIAVEPEADLGQARALLDGHRTVLVGHSGVGKSTLVNALIPGANRTVGDVSGIGKGRHTSTSAEALALPGGGYVIDTPGVRSFGLSHVTMESMLAAFPDLNAIAADCPRGCTHAAGAVDCALDAAVADGKLHPERLESFRRMSGAWQ